MPRLRDFLFEVRMALYATPKDWEVACTLQPEADYSLLAIHEFPFEQLTILESTYTDE